MQLDFSSIKGFFWAIVRIFYSLIPASFFLSIAIVLCHHFHETYPKSVRDIISYWSSCNQTIKAPFFFLSALVLTFITNTFEFIRWDDDSDTKPENALKDYDVELDEKISAKQIGFPNLTGVKIIQEYENVNTWTFTTMAHKDVLLGIYNYLNCLLVLFLPYYLHNEFETPNCVFLFQLIGQLAIFVLLFLGMKWSISKLSYSKNWGDKTISKTSHLLILSAIPILGLVLLLFPLCFSNNIVSSFAVLLAVNCIIIPVEFLMVLAAYNYHNRVRNMVDSAFVQIRFNDKIFRELKEERKETKE